MRTVVYKMKQEDLIYVLYEGYVTSATDGDRHELGLEELCKCYGLSTSRHNIKYIPLNMNEREVRSLHQGLEGKPIVVLGALTDGNYQEYLKEQIKKTLKKFA